MRQKILDNYRNHPKFDFGSSELAISTDLIRQFSAEYGDARSPISQESFRKAEATAGAIFHQLLEQTSDDLFVEFLEELQSEVERLMKSDLEFRSKIRSESTSTDGSADLLRAQNYFFGRISSDAVNEILAIGAKSLSKFRENARMGRLKRSDLSINSGPVVGRIARIIDREFKKQGIFSDVSQFVGIDYGFTGLSLELSYEGSTWWRDAIGNEQPPRTMYAHLDESIFAPKSIVYLSEVKSENGPTTLFPSAYQEMGNNPLQDIIGRVIGRVGSREGSRLAEHYRKTYHQTAGSREFRRHFMMLPEELRFNSHLGWDVMPGSDLEGDLAEREVEMLGPAGTFIVFDGSNLLHRGGLIREGERVVLQVVFYPGTRWVHRLKLATRHISRLFVKS